MMKTADIQLVIETLEDALRSYEGGTLWNPEKHIENLHKTINIMKRELRASKSRDKLDGLLAPRHNSVALDANDRAFGTVSDEQIEAVLMGALKDVQERSGLNTHEAPWPWD